MSVPLYELRDAGFAYDSAEILRAVSVGLTSGEFVCLAGPNGAGKSTLLGVMAGLLTQYRGACRFQGKEVSQWSRKAFAREVATVQQSLHVEFSFTVEQIVLMGRTPFAESLFESEADAGHVSRAMEMTGTTAFRERDFRSLSGGERQRVILASALAQTPRVLLLDEPTTYLDIQHQILLYRLLSKLCGEGLLVVSVTHDLNLAAQYASRIILINGGSVVSDGAPHAVLQPALLREVFQVDAEILQSPGGRPWIHYGA